MTRREGKHSWRARIRHRVRQFQLWLRVVIVALRVRAVRHRQPVDRRSGVGVGVIVRDGGPFVDVFLRHYLALGVDRITVLDNGSRDDTIQRALDFGTRVEVLKCGLAFPRWETAMKSYLVRRAGTGRRWALLVDIDEMFDFPGSDVVSLAELVAHLKSLGVSGMVAHLLDVFPPILDPKDNCFDPAAHDRFELDHVVSANYTDFATQHEVQVDTSNAAGMVFQLNGFRHHLLGFERPLWITKHALLHPCAGVWLSHPHLVQGAILAPTSAILVHHSLTGSTVAKARVAVAERRYGWSAQDEYSRYASKLEGDCPIRLAGPRTLRYHGPDQLLALGFLQVGRSLSEVIAERRNASAGTQ
ncbi:glycosyltransferase family 2 protein [Lentzea sp. NBC_00516]|uniref:glycosyltransferase family 2 protein n=1 Tax=Lentzea sp. NBC_00516 TaxID=2903582 RepID=UPI002E814E65|nr:glycosyltransferase family 2 protein [Lentzea sp. NBC_00516]WUD27188.1 glycosyltransferase family 2 protein [Lentzea sp. NBC_00516]